MSRLLRVLRNIIWQPTFTAPPPDLSSQTVLVTGPAPGGIGYATAKILASYGARLILAARNSTTAADAVSQIQAEVPNSIASPTECDLADLESVRVCAAELSNVSIDVLVCSEGLLVDGLKKTKEGVEMTFAVCVLGHHLLIELLRPKRVVWVTGDIYLLARGVPAPYTEIGGHAAYSGASLGRLWMAREWKKKGLQVICVHHGMVYSGPSKFERTKKKAAGRVMSAVDQGAEASVLAASLPGKEIHQDWDIPYYHNKFGWMQLTGGDKGISVEKGRKLFELCDEICGIKRC